MSKPKGLYRTTIVIWTEYPPQGSEIDDLARDAMTGDAYCSQQETDYVVNQGEFPSTEFFDGPDDLDEVSQGFESMITI